MNDFTDLKEKLMEEFKCSRNSADVHQLLRKKIKKSSEPFHEYMLHMKKTPVSGMLKKPLCYVKSRTSTRLLFVPKGAQHDQHPTNQAVATLGTVPGAQKTVGALVWGGLWALEWAWHSAETNLRCTGISGMCMPNPSIVACIVSEISAFIRADGQTDRRLDGHV